MCFKLLFKLAFDNFFLKFLHKIKGFCAKKIATDTT